MRQKWDDIASMKRLEVEEAQKRYSLSLVSALCQEAQPVNSLYVALGLGKHQPKFVADLSRKFNREDKGSREYSPKVWANHMLSRGVVAFFFGTDKATFGGDLEELKQLREELDLPLIRRDFIVDEYQIYQSRAAGADSVTLHASLHDLGSLQYHIEVSRELGMEPVVLAHDIRELEMIMQSDALIVGASIHDDNLNSILVPLRQAAYKDTRLSILVDSATMNSLRLKQFVLTDFHGVIYSYRSLGYEMYTQSGRLPTQRDQTKE